MRIMENDSGSIRLCRSALCWAAAGEAAVMKSAVAARAVAVRLSRMMSDEEYIFIVKCFMVS